jgi:hypothetical protein
LKFFTEVIMKVNFRFFVWGTMVLLSLVFAGCSLPTGGTGQEEAPPSQETVDGGEELPGGEHEAGDGGENLGGEQEAGDGGEENPGEGQEAGDGGEENPGEGQEDGDEGGEENPGEEQEAGNEGGENPGGEQETGDGGEENPGGEQEAGDGGEENPGEGQEDGDGGEENPGGAPDLEGPGFLSWDIEYPKEKVWGAALVVSLKINEDTFVPYTQFDLRGDETGSQKISLPPGTYRMESRLLSHHETAGSAELVHIYPGLETQSTPIIVPETVFPEARKFSSTAELKTYLEGLPENTGAAPYPVKMTGVDLSSKEKTGETLRTLYDALSGRYVSLDLRECTGTELIAASTYSMANRANIVSLILPDSITGINSNGFSGYTALKFAVLPGVATINTSAFKNCGELEALFAPALETVAEASSNSTGAFTGCTALEALYAPRLEELGKYALYGCSSLGEIALPRLRILGGLAFKKCTALKALSLPSAARIDSGSFDEDTAFSYLILGLNPPELAKDVFKDTGLPQTGLIFVPPEALDAYKDTGLSNWSGLKERVRPLPDPAAP